MITGEETNRYMMATRASHRLGDVSRDEPSLAIVYDETDADYIGEWATGIGFINVRFPKDSTRELTEDEKRYYRGKYLELAGAIRPIHIEDDGIGAEPAMPADPLPSFVIGRSEQADYQVDDEYASPRHAVIRPLGRGLFTIEDAGSTNGVWLLVSAAGFQRVCAPTPLPATAIVRIGRTEIAADGLLYAFAAKVAKAAGVQHGR